MVEYDRERCGKETIGVGCVDEQDKKKSDINKTNLTTNTTTTSSSTSSSNTTNT